MLKKCYRVYAWNFGKSNSQDICKLLREVHTIAVVGLSPNMARPALRGQALQSFGYRIFPCGLGDRGIGREKRVSQPGKLA